MQRTLHFHDVTGMDSRSSAPPSTCIVAFYVHMVVDGQTNSLVKK